MKVISCIYSLVFSLGFTFLFQNNTKIQTKLLHVNDKINSNSLSLPKKKNIRFIKYETYNRRNNSLSQLYVASANNSDSNQSITGIAIGAFVLTFCLSAIFLSIIGGIFKYCSNCGNKVADLSSEVVRDNYVGANYKPTYCACSSPKVFELDSVHNFDVHDRNSVTTASNIRQIIDVQRNRLEILKKQKLTAHEDTKNTILKLKTDAKANCDKYFRLRDLFSNFKSFNSKTQINRIFNNSDKEVIWLNIDNLALGIREYENEEQYFSSILTDNSLYSDHLKEESKYTNSFELRSYLDEIEQFNEVISSCYHTYFLFYHNISSYEFEILDYKLFNETSSDFNTKIADASRKCEESLSEQIAHIKRVDLESEAIRRDTFRLEQKLSHDIAVYEKQRKELNLKVENLRSIALEINEIERNLSTLTWRLQLLRE